MPPLIRHIGILPFFFLAARQKELLEEFAKINGDEISKGFKDKLKDLFAGAK